MGHLKEILYPEHTRQCVLRMCLYEACNEVLTLQVAIEDNEEGEENDVISWCKANPWWGDTIVYPNPYHWLLFWFFLLFFLGLEGGEGEGGDVRYNSLTLGHPLIWDLGYGFRFVFGMPNKDLHQLGTKTVEKLAPLSMLYFLFWCYWILHGFEPFSLYKF